MKVRVLGPLQVETQDGTAISLPDIQARLLARLYVSVNRVVTTDALIEDLWEDGAPGGARSTLRAHISKLRKSLGDPDRIVAEAGGYRLVVGTGESDLDGFIATVEAARQLLQDGSVAPAAASYADALARWRGPVLPGVSDAPWAEAYRARLEELRIVALEEMVDCELAAGHHATVVGELETLTQSHPYRERLWAALMLALYRSGRQAEALRVYQTVRNTLVGELGIEPGRELQELEATILRQDPCLDRPPAPDAGPSRHVVPLPIPLEHRPGAGVVGRNAQRSALWAATQAAGHHGQVRVALISGEAGIGKTTLLSEAARRAHEAGAIVLFGRCEEDLAVPYKPWIEALTHLTSHGPDALLTSVSAQIELLAAMAPGFEAGRGTRQPNLTADPDASRYMFFNAVAAILRAAGELAPVVVAIDDLQWADAASQQLLRHVAGSGEPARLLVLGSFRDSDVGSPHPLGDLLSALRRGTSNERVALRGLDASELLALIEGTAGESVGSDGPALRDALLTETDGNPFLVGEVLRHLSDSGAFDTGGWTAGTGARPFGVPLGVREVVGRRVERLGADTARLLAISSLVGRDFDISLVAQVAELEEEAVLDLLDHAVDASLVENVDEDRYAFVHGLIEHTLHDSLGPARRARIHRRIGECLEARGENPGRLARHFSLATGPTALDKAIRYSRLAADEDLRHLAPDEARVWYAQALSLLERESLPSEEVRVDLLVGLGDAQRQAGHPDYRQTLLDAAQRAQRLGSVELLVAAALANNRGWASIVGLIDAERVEMLEAAASALTDDGSPARAQLLAQLAVELVYGEDFERRRALADEAMAIARRCDSSVVAQTGYHACLAITAPDTLDERLNLSLEALDAAGMDGDPVLQFWTTLHRSVVLTQAGDVDEADFLLQAAGGLGEQLGQPLVRWRHAMAQSTRAMLVGDLLEAERHALEAVKLGRDLGQSDANFILAAQMGPIRYLQGRTDEILEFARQGISDNPSLPAFEVFLAQCYCDLGRHDDASATLERLAAEGFSPLWRDRDSGLLSMTSAASVVSALGWQDAAEQLFSELLPYATQIPYNVVATYGCQVTYYLGLLAATAGRAEQAEQHFAAAAAAHERIGSHRGLAVTRLAWAELLLDRGPAAVRDQAAGLLGQALKGARTHGYGRVEQEAQARLAGL